MDRPRTDIALPPYLAGRPRDHRGFVIPYFVAWLDDAGRQVAEPNGTPDFRIIDQERFAKCVRLKLCWLCGQKLGKHLAFVIGPMCAITRTTSEPPSHYGCAHYAVQVCPFLSRPRMRRNDKDWPSDHREMPGITIDRNPGVSLIWMTRSYHLFEPEKGGAGVLVQVGDPTRLEWWREGRTATRDECLQSINDGLPALREVADLQGDAARRELEERYIPRLGALLPP